MRLGLGHLAILGAGLLTALSIVWIVEGPDVVDLYVRDYGLPRLEERWGFRFGPIPPRDRVDDTRYGIIRLVPDGRFARLGFRLHDTPFTGHGHGATAFYEALRASERGKPVSIDVVNVDEWSARRGLPAFRTIQIRPQ
jgi:hypothetical protein